MLEPDPQKIYASERKDMSNNSEAVGVRFAKKRGSILILLSRGVSQFLIVKQNVLSWNFISKVIISHKLKE